MSRRPGSRPKGWMTWKPSHAVGIVVTQVQEILAEYAGYGPMTVRQIFYRLVGEYGYPKDERAYKRLAEYLVKARRAGMIPFHRIRDDGTISQINASNSDRRDVWMYMQDIIARPADFLHLDRNTNQPHHIELWCEAAGMAPMLSQMVRSRDINVYSTGGFSSVTVTYEVAQRVLKRDQPTYFLHVGDYDPSGESIFTSMSQDIGAFVVGEVGGTWDSATGETDELDGECNCLFIPRRIALTEEQVQEYDLPSAPPKASDSRSANWYGETTQAEAMPPSLLEEVVMDAVNDLTDDDILSDLLDKEERDKERLRSAVEDWSVKDYLDDKDASLVELIEGIAKHDLEAE